MRTLSVFIFSQSAPLVLSNAIKRFSINSSGDTLSDGTVPLMDSTVEDTATAKLDEVVELVELRRFRV